jgi:bifunctional non-homologous end joining protein LigD
VAIRKSTSRSASRGGDPLADYRKKRDFGRTAEPRPERPRSSRPRGRGRKEGGTGLQFVVQKHDARRLHYDLRLELGGTLKSWAVTRGPSLIVGEKRLAVRTEDHPMEYLEFEGNIPKGEYGGGAMIVWDRGSWSSASDPEKGFDIVLMLFLLVLCVM